MCVCERVREGEHKGERKCVKALKVCVVVQV